MNCSLGVVNDRKKPFSMVLLAAALWLAVCALVSAVPSLATGAESPEAAARAYLAAVSSGQIDRAQTMISEVSKEYMSGDELVDPFGVAGQVDPASVEKLQLTTTWLDPFTCLVEGPMVREYSSRPQFSVVVAREKDQWRIKPISRAMTSQKPAVYPATFVASDRKLSYQLVSLTASADFTQVYATIGIEAQEPTVVDVASLSARLVTGTGEYRGSVTLYGFDGPEYKGDYGSYPLGPGLSSTVRITMEGGHGLPDSGRWELLFDDAHGSLGVMKISPMLSDPLVPGRWVNLEGEPVAVAHMADTPEN